MVVDEVSMDALRSIVVRLAATAVVGWYLIIPPSGSNGAPVANLPLFHWVMVHSFESAVECEAALNYVRKNFDETAGRALKPPTRDELVRAFDGMDYSKLARCIASDDPRLK